MSASFGWPWGDNHPTPQKRVMVATLIAALCGVWILYDSSAAGATHTDFAQVWFAARQMIAHRNPYQLVGPGREFEWPWGLFYPATSFALVLPVVPLPERVASATFVFFSVWMLVLGATRDSWHRLPAFASAAFVISVRAGQWAPLMTSGWFLPTAAIAWAAKPTLGLALLATAPTGKHRRFAIFGGIALVAISLFFLPAWPWHWRIALGQTEHMVPPLLQPGGFLLLIALLRWRRREALVIIAMALVPQSPSIYDALPILLLIPNTYREASLLSIISSAGALLMLKVPETSSAEFVAWRGTLLVATTYLPAVAIVLRRPNVMNDVCVDESALRR